MPDIAIAIPSFRRPLGLEKLLIALGQLRTDRAIGVIVADNDSDGQDAVRVCEKIRAQSYRWPLQSIVVAERGIAQVREALVRRALDDPAVRFIAMLDDDEWPEPDWLEELLKVQAQSGADVVRGTVLREYEIPPPRWASRWEGIAPIRKATGYSGMIEGIGNVLIARRCFEAIAAPFFDPRFGLTGGEDKELFVRLRTAGMRFVRAEDAVAHEHVPATRIRLSYLLKRTYRTGNTDMRIAMKHAGSTLALSGEIAKILGAIAAAPVLSIAYGAMPARRFDGLRKFFRAAGKIGALCGHRYQEYATTHGH